MIDFSRNHFELFGLPARFRLDGAALDRAYRELQGEVHPDRFAAAAEAERRLALQASARLNEAYRVLKEPVARAHYLLTLRGIDAFPPSDTGLPLAFLEQQLARREAAAEAAEAGDVGALEALLGAVTAEGRDVERELARLLDDEAAWDSARMRVRELKFLRKLAEDIDAMAAEAEA
jgi:molecular chaperone HscB